MLHIYTNLYTCIHIYTFSFFMFSEFSISVVCCLSLILEILSHYCFKYFALLFFFSFPFGIPIMNIFLASVFQPFHVLLMGVLTSKFLTCYAKRLNFLKTMYIHRLILYSITFFMFWQLYNAWIHNYHLI
jgi:hypothetical protein